jgi:glycine oxidase
LAIADITVRGGGIFGLSIAWQAVQRGAKVRLIETDHIGAGSSGGLVGALAPHTPENWNDKKAFQLESLLMADGFWAQVGEASGRDPGYARSGRVQAIADARAVELAQTRGENAKSLWQGRADWEVVEAARFDGWGPETPTGFVIHDTLSARLHPQQACAALAVALRQSGAEVILGEADEQGVVIEATGAAGLTALSGRVGKSVGVPIKGQAALFAFEARDKPQLFLDALHIIPHGDGTVAIGSTSEREFDDAQSTDSQLEDLIAKARSLCTSLQEAPVIARWAGLRPRAKSRAPMLGVHPLDAGRFIANGGFKIGFGMAPKVAEVMVDLMLGGRDAIPEGFRVAANL